MHYYSRQQASGILVKSVESHPLFHIWSHIRNRPYDRNQLTLEVGKLLNF